MQCPLCQNPLSQSFQTRRRPRELFWHCETCSLVSKDPSILPDAVTEKARYDEHQNGGEGHRRFLLPVVEAVTARYPATARGLDWGSGPVAVLAELLKERGYGVETYDPFFGPKEKPGGVFDFITLTEVIEHLHRPALELNELRERLKPGGRLIVQTDTYPGGGAGRAGEYFENWGYRNDPTHVSFFSPATFEFLGGRGWRVEHLEKRLVILCRT